MSGSHVCAGAPVLPATSHASSHWVPPCSPVFGRPGGASARGLDVLLLRLWLNQYPRVPVQPEVNGSAPCENHRPQPRDLPPHANPPLPSSRRHGGVERPQRDQEGR